MEDQNYEKIVERIEFESDYKKLKAQKKTTMSVPEMRKMLGLKKTDSYWLVHRGFFKTEVVGGRMRIDIESFEKWYANQVKHKKVDGEPPGKELRTRSMSVRDMGTLLGLHDSDVYEIWKKEGFEVFTVDFTKRITNEVFEEWYSAQTKYKKKVIPDSREYLEEKYLKNEDFAMLLGVTPVHIGLITRRGNYKDMFDDILAIDDELWISKDNILHFLNVQDRYKAIEKGKLPIHIRSLFPGEYINRSDACIIAGVSSATISNWVGQGHFTAIPIGREIRIKRAEFMEFLEKRKEQDNGINQRKKR